MHIVALAVLVAFAIQAATRLGASMRLYILHRLR